MKQENGPLITSKDGFNAYFLIMDVHSRYMWVFPTLGKSPPIFIVESFLERYSNKNGNRSIRTDNGGGLAGSHAFQQLICRYNYVLETTVADSSLQNGIVERGH